MLKITHNAGFFSCCTIRLYKIIEYFNEHKRLPEVIDSSEQYQIYKNKPGEGDITLNFFENYKNINIDLSFNHLIEFVPDDISDYSRLNFKDLDFFIKKYFSPSKEVTRIKKLIEQKYNIDYKNTCAIFLRGNDKSKETNQPSYEEMLNKANLLQKQNPDMKFLIQTDEAEFLKYMLTNLNNSFEIKELLKINHNKNLSIQYVINPNDKLLAVSIYIATILVMSQCKNIIHTSGNGEMFMILYRGSPHGCFQYLNEKEFVYGVKNNSFNPNKKDHWIIH